MIENNITIYLDNSPRTAKIVGIFFLTSKDPIIVAQNLKDLIYKKKSRNN